MDRETFFWDSMECYLVLPSFTGFYLVLPSSTEFLEDLIGPGNVFLGFFGVLPSFT